MNVYEVAAKIALNTKEFITGLDESANKTKSFGSNIAGTLGKAGKAAAAGLAAVGTAVTGATVAFKKGVDAVAEYGDNIDKMSQKMGMSANAYQEWDFVMTHCGASIESLKASMKTMANAAESGNAAFQRLGISQEQIASMSQEDLFAATISGLQNVTDTTERTYLAGQLLGRGATELGALLNMSAEDTEAMKQALHDLGGAMSDDAVKAAARYEDSLYDLQTAFGGAKRTILGEFMPGMATVYDGLAKIFSGQDGGVQLVTNGINQIVNSLTTAMPQIAAQGANILQALGQGILQNLPMLMQTGANIIMNMITGIVNALPMVIQSAAQIILALAQGIIANLPQLIPAITQAVTTIVVYLTDPSVLPLLIEAAVQIMAALAEGLIQAIPELTSAVPQIIENLIQSLLAMAAKLLQTGVELMGNFVSGMVSGVADLPSKISAKITEMVTTVTSIISGLVSSALTWGSDFVENLKQGVIDKVEAFIGKVREIADQIRALLHFSVPDEGPLREAPKWMPDMLKLFAKGITDNASTVTGAVSKVFGEVGKTMMDTINIGAKNAAGQVIQTVEDLKSAISEKFNSIKSEFNMDTDISELQFDLWEKTNGADLSDADKFATKLEMLKEQLMGQESVVGAAQAAYEKIKAQYGETADETKSYLKTLLEEKIAYQDLKQSITEAYDAMNKAGSSVQGGIAVNYKIDEPQTQSVPFSDAALAKVSEVTLNAMNQNKENQKVDTTIKLVTPDGKVISQMILKDLLNVAKSMGVPLVASY